MDFELFILFNLIYRNMISRDQIIELIISNGKESSTSPNKQGSKLRYVFHSLCGFHYPTNNYGQIQYNHQYEIV